MGNWPLFIKSYITDEDDQVFALDFKLVEIVKQLTSLEFHSYEIDPLNESVLDYLDARNFIRMLYPKIMHRPKSKQHI